MSILETFYILFKSDTSNLKKGSEDAIKSTKQLNQSLKDTDNISGKLGERLLGILTPLSGIIAGFASVNAIISGFKNTLDYDIDLGKTSRALGINIELLDAWDNAVRHAGGSAEGFQASIRSLAEHFNTNPSVAIKFLPQLADVFHRISRFSAFKLGKSLGITDEATILLLQRGRREVEAVIKRQYELGVVTKKDQELTTIYNNSLIDLDISYRKLSNTLLEDLLPGIVKFFGFLQKGFGYLKEHKDIVIGAFVGIGAAAIAAGIAFIPLSLEVGLLTLGVLAAIAAFSLLWEDTQVYFNGGNSLIGEFIDEFKRLNKIMNDSLDTWIDKLVRFLNKFSIFKSLATDISNIKNQSNGQGFDLIGYYTNKALNDAESSPINNQSTNSVINSQLFNRDNNIHIEEINMQVQSNDAQGIAIGLRAELHKYLFSEYDKANGNFSNNVGY
jgi:hypothetical protein